MGRKSKRRRRHTREFKLNAVQLSLDESKTIKEHAEDLGIHLSLLHRWRQRYLGPDGQVGEAEPERVTELEAEVQRLKNQLERKDEEVAFLKKAAAYFAGRPESDTE